MSSEQRPSVTQLWLSFLRLGATAFGGPSMVVYIRKMAVEEKHWIDAEAFDDGVALCQTIPGATALQTAAYVGVRTQGVIGAGASFIGFSFPAFLLMMIFAGVYVHTRNFAQVASTFTGLQAIIVAITANATLSFGRANLKEWKHSVIAGIAAVLFALSVNPVFVVMMAALAGLAILKPKRHNPSRTASWIPMSPSTMPLSLILSAAAMGFLLLFFFHRPLFTLGALMVKVDAFAFGGGFASVPLMFREVVEARHWMDSSTFMDGIVLGQLTPGPIVITATFVGYLVRGWPGAIVGTIGIFLPSFLMVVGIAPYFERLRARPSFNKTVSGVLCSFVGLLLAVTLRFAISVHWDVSHLLIGVAAFVALVLKVDILVVVLIGTAISFLLLA